MPMFSFHAVSFVPSVCVFLLIRLLFLPIYVSGGSKVAGVSRLESQTLTTGLEPWPLTWGGQELPTGTGAHWSFHEFNNEGFFNS